MPEAGDKYVYRGDGIGIDAGRLAAGTSVTVREVVPADVPGAHDDSEDAVVIEWQSPTVVNGEDGPELGFAIRAMSIGVDQFNEDFEVEA